MPSFYKKSLFPAIILGFILALCCVFIFLRGSYAEPTSNKVSTLRVCSDAGFLPFEMKNNAGEWEGFDVEMMEEFAKSINAKLVMVQISFDGIIPALLSKKCDMIAAGMTVTPSRKQVVSFSKPTFQNGLSIAIKNTAENNDKFKDLMSLDKIGVKIAVKTGYTSDIYLSKNLKNAKILRFDQDTDLVLAVLQERADAFMSDATYVSLISKENQKKFITLPTNVTSEEFSVAIRPDDKELLRKFNAFLDKWKGSPAYSQLYDKYFKH